MGEILRETCGHNGTEKFPACMELAECSKSPSKPLCQKLQMKEKKIAGKKTRRDIFAEIRGVTIPRRRRIIKIVLRRRRMRTLKHLCKRKKLWIKKGEHCRNMRSRDCLDRILVDRRGNFEICSLSPGLCDVLPSKKCICFKNAETSEGAEGMLKCQATPTPSPPFISPLASLSSISVKKP